nr:immunoglobulin heavy chain junction region [Macaca mulatta]MOX91874.1 immunoglobulin heavy chain junction region [Macaca mulatta]MOX91939.1 immunoglobulin heavy chain junction region [Macaca mulatta]MOX92034.1 immunoglobulin heavy chain junction region [Macaca mulatta]MOX92067.1 immunoglobulin heavy chain junction region [Macaca mulatta]
CVRQGIVAGWALDSW